MDNFSYFTMKTYVVAPHKNRLDEMVLMRGHKIRFYGEICLIIPKLSLLSPLLSGAVKTRLLTPAQQGMGGLLFNIQCQILALLNKHISST